MSSGEIVSLYPLVQQQVVLSHSLYHCKLIIPEGVDVVIDFVINAEYGGQYLPQQSSSEPRCYVQKLVNLAERIVLFESNMLY